MNWNLALDRYLEVWTRPEVGAEIPDAVEPQREFAARFRELLTCGDRSADRSHYEPGHLTGSAVIVTPDYERVLLTHHRKLNRWLQLGGHTDGSLDAAMAAMREAEEESGLERLRFADYEARAGAAVGDHPLLWDLDIHWIPPGKEPGHYHYDARYLLVADDPDRIRISDESHDLKWFSWHDAYTATYERGMHRLFDKVKYILSR